MVRLFISIYIYIVEDFKKADVWNFHLNFKVFHFSIRVRYWAYWDKLLHEAYLLFLSIGKSSDRLPRCLWNTATASSMPPANLLCLSK